LTYYIEPEPYKYIRNALLTGKSREAIKSELLANGWWEDTIEQAMTMIFDQPVPKATAFNQFSRKTRYVYVVLTVIAFVLLGAFVGVFGSFLSFMVAGLMAAYR
jgi:hypothetical protein